MKLTGTRIGRAKLTPKGKIEPSKSWARAKDHRKAARLEKAWKGKSKPKEPFKLASDVWRDFVRASKEMKE